MATEVFNLSGYVFESAAFNAEFAVFNRNVSPYIVESPAVAASAAVFNQSLGLYLIGGTTPSPNHVSAGNLRLYRLEGPANGNAPGPSVQHTRVYEIFGGRDLPLEVVVPDTIMYMITD